MNNAHSTPKISIELAYKWLNSDTYWASPTSDPCDPNPEVSIPPKTELPRPISSYPHQLVQKYPLADQMGQTRRSRLHDPLEPDLGTLTIVEQLVLHLREELANRNWSEARAKIGQIETICLSLQKNNPNTGPLQLAEARLEFGLAYHAMGENAKALEQFELCIKSFGSDSHAEAIARWLAGHIQLETPKIHINECLANWQRSWEIFTQAVTDGRRPKPQVEWYKDRAKRMFDDLQTALAYGETRTGPTVGASPPPPPPAPNLVRLTSPRPAPKPSAKGQSLPVLILLPIAHSVIHAGEAGVVLNEIDDYAATEEVTIHGVPHTFHRFHNARDSLELQPGHEYRLMRVEGDSMDQLFAPGDYVVLAIPKDGTFAPSPGDIVAAEFSDANSDETEVIATLKEWRPVPGGIELRPRSNNPTHRSQTYYESLPEARALAVGVLKPRA